MRFGRNIQRLTGAVSQLEALGYTVTPSSTRRITAARRRTVTLRHAPLGVRCLGKGVTAESLTGRAGWPHMGCLAR